MTDTIDNPEQAAEHDAAPNTDPVQGEPDVSADDASLTQELEAVTARVEADEPEPDVAEEPVSESDAEPTPEPEPEPVSEPDAETAPEPEAEPAPDGDDIEAALASAEEKVASEATLDDIAPGTVAHDPSAEPADTDPVTVSNSVPWWPFVAYDVLWLIFAGALVWYFEQLPPGTAVFESSVYGLTVLVGIVLAAFGPALIIATWFGTFGREGASKGALFFSALVRGSVATVLGVAMWWVALLVLDQLRLGRIL